MFESTWWMKTLGVIRSFKSKSYEILEVIYITSKAIEKYYKRALYKICRKYSFTT